MKPTETAANMVPSRTPSRWPKNDNDKTTPMATMVMSKNGFTFPKSV